METYLEEMGPGGRVLWRALIARDPELGDELNPMQVIAIDACRAQDRADALNEIYNSVDVMIDNGKGQPVAHPAWVESRKLANHIEMMINALRLPDTITGKRPQRHTGAIHGRRTGVKWDKKPRKGSFFDNNPGGGDSA